MSPYFNKLSLYNERNWKLRPKRKTLIKKKNKKRESYKGRKQDKNVERNEIKSRSRLIFSFEKRTNRITLSYIKELSSCFSRVLVCVAECGVGVGVGALEKRHVVFKATN